MPKIEAPYHKIIKIPIHKELIYVIKITYYQTVYQNDTSIDAIPRTDTFAWKYEEIQLPFLPPSTAPVTGKVTDMNIGDPVAGATIALDGLTYTTASNGTYSFNIETGSYVISVNIMGYEPKTVSVNANEVKTYSS